MRASHVFSSPAVALTQVAKRPVGRPRKHPLPAPVTVVPTEATPKRRGRPPKIVPALQSTASVKHRKVDEVSPKAAALAVPDCTKRVRRRKSDESPFSSRTTKIALKPKITARKPSTKTKLPARLNVGSPKHWDLTSYLAYQKQRNADPNSSSYKGTHFEYTTIESLKPWGFLLSRKGQTGDRGIDLHGTWTLPDGSGPKVIISCKASRPDPKHVRELAGSVNAAPAGWDHDRVLCLYVSCNDAKEGTFDAVDREHRPMGFLHITADGKVMRVYTNNAAKDVWLTAMSTSPKNKAVKGKVVQDGLNFEWMGKPWKPSC